jgi:hypothetical protein
MTDTAVKNHFWIAGPPIFSSTLLISSATADSSGAALEAACELFDVDGTKTQSFNVEFPANEVGIVEIEPFMAGLKTQGGITQGHLVVTTPANTRQICRLQLGKQVDLLSEPKVIKNREMAFMPLLLGAKREHLMVLLNTGEEVCQVVTRLLYGSRSPEWTTQIPPYGCRVVSLEHELLSTFDDLSWQKGISQGYLRISPRAQSSIVCQMIEKLPGETEDNILYRNVCAW